MQKLSQPNLDEHSRANLLGVLQYSTSLTEGCLHTFCNIGQPTVFNLFPRISFLHAPPPPGEGGIDSLGSDQIIRAVILSKISLIGFTLH